MVSKKKIEEILNMTVNNAKEDRDKANSLLKDVSVYIGSGNAGNIVINKHGEVGLAASKYLDNLTKSNEILLKAAEMYKKMLDKSEEEEKITEQDTIDFYEEIEKSKEEKKN